MRKYLTLLILFLLVGCSNIPQSGRVSIECDYTIYSTRSVSLDCFPGTLPATFTLTPTSSPTQTVTLIPTQPPMSSTPTRIPGPTNSPGPTQLPRPGYPVTMVVRNDSTDRVRVRSCPTAASEANPATCPQALLLPKDTIDLPCPSPYVLDGGVCKEYFWIHPSTAFLVHRIHYPFNTSNYVWLSLSPDGGANRYWTAACFNNTQLLQLFNMSGYSVDPLGSWWILYQAGDIDPLVNSCHYPLG